MLNLVKVTNYLEEEMNMEFQLMTDMMKKSLMKCHMEKILMETLPMKIKMIMEIINVMMKIKIKNK